MIKPASYLNQPIFISGYHKSGTTLFLSILDSHPELVVIPEELNFFKSVLFSKDPARAIREKSGFKIFLSSESQQEMEHWRTQYREGYPEFNKDHFNRLLDHILASSRSYKELLLGMVDAFAQVDFIEPTQKHGWVSKTPLEENYFPIMQKMFGRNCRLVYALRDPRDVYTSISRWKENRGKEGLHDMTGILKFCVYWQTRLHQAQAYQKKYSNVRIFRYEDLLKNTENTLKQLCHFLEIKYSPELLLPTRHGKEWGGNSVYTEQFKGLSSEPVGRYKHILDPKTCSILEQILHKDLVQFNYINEQAPSPTGAQIPWREYQIAYTKYRLRYHYNQIIDHLRFQFQGI